MRKLITLCATLAAFTGLAVADTWSGVLLDSGCASRNPTSECQARRSSRRYVLEGEDGTLYSLDSRTNTNVRSALIGNRRLRRNQPIDAMLSGRLRSSGRIRAHVIALQAAPVEVHTMHSISIHNVPPPASNLPPATDQQ